MAWPKGTPRPEETKARMRAAHAGRVGRPQTEETKAKISAARKAREAAKPPKPARVPGRKSGWKWTDEQRARLSVRRKQITFGEEGRARLSEARARQWQAMTEDERASALALRQLREVGVIDPRRHRARRPSGPCQKCDTVRRSLHREHIVPRWKGGSDEASNIQWICANCHEDKTRADLIGRPGWNKGRTHSEASRQKMRAAAARRVADGYVGSTADARPAESHADGLTHTALLTRPRSAPHAGPATPESVSASRPDLAETAEVAQ